MLPIRQQNKRDMLCVTNCPAHAYKPLLAITRGPLWARLQNTICATRSAYDKTSACHAFKTHSPISSKLDDTTKTAILPVR